MIRYLKYAIVASLLLFPSVSLSAHAAGGGSEPEDKAVTRITGSKIYVAVTGLNIPIAEWDGFSGMVAVDVGLEIADNDMRKKAVATMPRIRDSLRRSIHSYMNGTYMPGTVPNLEMMGDRMQRVIDHSLGEGVAKVTIASAIIHPYS